MITPGTDDLLAVLTMLLATCYICDLEYPRMYSQALGFMQTFLFDEPYRMDTSKNYIFFIKKVLPLFEEEMKKDQ